MRGELQRVKRTVPVSMVRNYRRNLRGRHFVGHDVSDFVSDDANALYPSRGSADRTFFITA